MTFLRSFLVPAVFLGGPVVAFVISGLACAADLDSPDRFASGLSAPTSPTTGGAGATGAAGGAATSNCGDVPKTLLVPKCATAGCHSSSSPASGLDLQSADIAARVVGKAGQSCGLLVDPMSPNKSSLYTKLSKSTCGSIMPLGGKALTADESKCVLEWITSLK